MSDQIFETIGDDPGFLGDCSNRTSNTQRFMLECCLVLREAIRECLEHPAPGRALDRQILELHASVLDWIIEFFTRPGTAHGPSDLMAIVAALNDRVLANDPEGRTHMVQPDAVEALRNFFGQGAPAVVDRHNAFWALMRHHEEFGAIAGIGETLPLFFLNAYYMAGHGLHFLRDHWRERPLQERLVDALYFDRNARTTHFELAIAGVLGCCGIRLRPRTTFRRRGQSSPDYDILVFGQQAGVLECRIREVITPNPTNWIVQQIQEKAGQVADAHRPRVVALDTNTPGLSMQNLDRQAINVALQQANQNMEHLVVASTNIVCLDRDIARLDIEMIPFLEARNDAFQLLLQSCREI